MARPPRHNPSGSRPPRQDAGIDEHDHAHHFDLPPSVVDQVSTEAIERDVLAKQLGDGVDLLRKAAVLFKQSDVDPAFFDLWHAAQTSFDQFQVPPPQQIQYTRELLARLEASATQQSRSTIPLPDTAPERWELRDQSKRETAVEFARRVYFDPWIAAGVMARKDWLHLDEPLYKAYGVRISRHPEEAIPELETQTDWVDNAVAELSDRYTADELRKLGLALEYRRKRASQDGA